MKLYRSVPIELFRVQNTLKVKLRDFQKQTAKGSKSFDFKLHEDGLIHPVPSDQFRVPNGMSLRPGGPNLSNILAHFKGKHVVYRIPEGVAIPENLVLYHEHSDHYAMQTTVPCTEKELNARLTEFLHKNAEQMTLDDYFKLFPLF